jgi:hypothetical protein
MPIEQLPLWSGYDKQRFKQFSPADCANWYGVDAPSGKKGKALYPAMGRRHININGVNLLNFELQPRKIFKSIDFAYVIVADQVWRINSAFSKTIVNGSEVFTRKSGLLSFAYLPVVTIPGDNTPPAIQNVYVMLCDGYHIFIINEKTNTMEVVTDPLAPPNPAYCAAFGNRFVVSTRNSTQFQLSKTNFGGTLDVNTCFTIAGAAVFAQESGLIRQMAVLQNQLYIFTDFTTGIWSNTPSTFQTAVTTTFPWRKNTSFEFNYGIADPDSLDVDFGMMIFLAQNRNGLVTFMMSSGQSPQPIATLAINTFLQRIANASAEEDRLDTNTIGFLYQYEDTIFYRATIGPWVDYETIDNDSYAISFEYNFTTKTWARCIELNTQRNRIVEHEFFNNRHLVTVQDQTCIYDMSGSVYFNELQNPLVSSPQDPLAFLAYPMRYELTTPIISQEDYSEFITKYIEIDFVYGDSTYLRWGNGFANTVFIIGELPDSGGDPVYMVAEDGVTYIVQDGTATPSLDESIYDDLFKPHIELYISDNGGISFYAADVLEFSQLGVYQWRMRWYQGGASRNRVYKLVAVSAAPIVVLGGVMLIERSSGGAN